MAARWIALLSAWGPVPALACSPCRAYVEAGIFDGSFALKLLVMAAPVIVVVLGAVLLYLSGKERA
ncbi:MAG: hypothetical protein EOO30_15405 [Comamonadaceae bacterium]|nr:MAG: hypothetical protein EOO30_15405 [Comamonadaceae bacterium]